MVGVGQGRADRVIKDRNINNTHSVSIVVSQVLFLVLFEEMTCLIVALGWSGRAGGVTQDGNQLHTLSEHSCASGFFFSPLSYLKR